MYYSSTSDYITAENMYKKALLLSTKLKDKISAYHGLGNVMLAQNNPSQAANYFKKETEAMDSLAEKNRQEKVKDIQYEFDSENAKQSSIRKMSIFSYICVSLGCLLTFALLAILLIRRSNNHRIMQISGKIKTYAGEIAELKTLDSDNKREIERLTNEMRKSMDNYIKTITLGRRLYDGLSLGKFVEKRDSNAMKSLITFYKVVDPDFFEDVAARYDKLTTQNLLILMLQHLGKNNDEIAQLLNVSAVSMRSYLSRIKRCKKQEM